MAPRSLRRTWFAVLALCVTAFASIPASATCLFDPTPRATATVGELAALQLVPRATPLSPPVLETDPIQVQLWIDAALQHYLADEIDQAMTLYLRAAACGDRSALYNAAVIRIRGETERPQLERAIAMLLESAQAGFAPAQFSYAVLFDLGTIVTQDLPKAQRWYLRAAEQGHADAAEALATGYYLGRGSAQDYVQAARWYEVAARAGDPGVQYVLGSMYEAGLGVAPDLELALQWYVEAARQGDVAAQGKARELSARRAAQPTR